MAGWLLAGGAGLGRSLAHAARSNTGIVLLVWTTVECGGGVSGGTAEGNHLLRPNENC